MRYAMVRAAGITLAVSANEVGQALQLAESAAHLPRSERTLLGVFEHRGQVVPVVDLACWGSLQPPGDGAAPAQVLLLHKSGRVTGIAIERTVGIALVEPGAVQRVHHENAGQELFHSVLQVPGFEQPFPLLDTEHLLQQTQVWVQEQPAIRQALGGSAASDSPPFTEGSIVDGRPTHTETHVVVELGGLRLAVPVQSVGTLMPAPAMQKLPNMATGLLGVFAWGARQVPVVRMHQALGLQQPAPDSPPEPWLLLVRTDNEALGILVDHFVAVQKFDSRRLQPAGLPLGAGVAPDPGDPAGRPIQLLSVAALFSAMPVGAIGADPQRGTPAPGNASMAQSLEGRSRDGTPVSTEAHLVFKAGRTMATPLKGIQEVVMDDAATGAADLPRTTHFQWRGTLVPLLDLRLATEGVPSAAGAEARMLIVKEGNQLTALVVEAVIDLVPAFVGTLVSLQMNQGRTLQVLTAPIAGRQESFEIVDIGQQSLVFQDRARHAQDRQMPRANHASRAAASTASQEKARQAEQGLLPS
jgi:chemotaxis signal transduction protein